MQNNKTLDNDQGFLNILRSIALAYEDISIIKMQQTRNTIVQARNYIAYLRNILESIQTTGSYKPDNNYIQRKKKPLARVIITANTRFQGDITRKIFDFFAKKHEDTGDIYIIGHLGRELIKDYNKNLTYSEFKVSDIDISMKDLQPFLKRLLEYKEIHVYYGLLQNLMVQEPATIDIGNIDLLSEEEMIALRKVKPIPHFLFEPSVEEISTFVNDNSVALMLLQTVYETQLARFASRMKAMDSLIQRIDDDVVKIQYTAQKMRRYKESAKQQERLTGFSLW